MTFQSITKYVGKNVTREQEYKNILNIFSYRRQHMSKGEEQFIKDYMSDFEPIKDNKGMIIAFKYDNHNPTAINNILWTSHIDTVHHSEPNKIFQEVYMDDMTKTAFVTEKCDCLGADDGAGVWLMLEMIKNNVEGTYMFFRGEEQGCIGSSAMAKEYEEYLKNFTHAIAFDRKGKTDVITYQRGECCSEEFGKAMADVLGMGYEPSDLGVYTDTAEFLHLIPECSNLSVGYQSQHTSTETQDLAFLIQLRDKLISVDWANTELPIVREPKHEDHWGWSANDMYGDNYYVDVERYAYMDKKDLIALVKSKTPEELAEMLQDCGHAICDVIYGV